MDSIAFLSADRTAASLGCRAITCESTLAFSPSDEMRVADSITLVNVGALPPLCWMVRSSTRLCSPSDEIELHAEKNSSITDGSAAIGPATSSRSDAFSPSEEMVWEERRICLKVAAFRFER
jgi:hypothetical protein